MARRLRSLPWAVALGPDPRRRARQPHRPALPGARPVRRATWSTSSACSTRTARYFPIFNVADSALFCGVVLAILLEFTGRRRDGTPGVRRCPSDAERRHGTHDRRGARRDRRALPVPDGLDGMRLDQAVSRLFGLSRTAGGGPGRGRRRARRRRGPAEVRQGRAPGAWLEVTLPAPPRGRPVVAPQPVDGLRVVYSDDDIVVVDKPVGVAAHPSPGWTGPTVIGGLAAMGHTIATSGAAERQGVVHRLDVGTTGLMVVAKSETRVQPCSSGRSRRARSTSVYHAVVQGHLDPLRGTIDAPIDRHPTHDYKWAVVSGGKPSVTHYDTLEAFPAASLVESSWRPAAPTRSGCTSRRCGTRASAT